MSDSSTVDIIGMTASASLQPATILVVDDEPIGREMLGALLSAEGHQIMFAGDGEEALAKASRLAPDLILLDVMMPNMDGFEVCRRLRADPWLGDIPVIMLTALDDRASRLRAIEAGVDDFVSKPFDRIELRARVRTITRLNRYRRLLLERMKFSRVIELAPDGILIADNTGLILLVNPAMVQLLGVDRAEDLLGQHISAYIVPAQRQECLERLDSVIAEDESVVRFETMLLRSDEARLPVEMHVGAFVWEGCPAIQIIARDIAERKRAELLEEERHHIAYELHDGLAQIVTSTHQHLQAFAARYHPRSPQARDEFTTVLDLARRAVREVRRVIGGLRPTALDDFGLAAALQMQVAALQAEGWDVSFHETLGAERLAPAIETVVFRVTQEALSNIRKHAQTKSVALTLTLQGNQLSLVVQDWGRGFDLAAVASQRAGLGERIGLRGMRERIALLGGQWHIESSPGQGTRIVATLPLPLRNKGDMPHEV